MSGNMIKTIQASIFTIAAISVGGCVTQQYLDENDNPVVQNEASNNEIALTRIQLGIGYLNMGNTKQAKFNLEKAKYFAPRLVQVHTAFAHYYETVGEPEQASKSYQDALSIKDDDPDTLNNFGVFLCRQGELKEAEKQFLKAIAVPSYILVSESYENLALCHLKEQEYDKAEEYLDKAIEHSPSRASSLLQMASLLYAKADYKNALNYIKRYEKATRRFSPDGLALSFKVYEKLRDIKTAKNYAAMLLKMFPNSYEAKQYLLNGLVEIEADKLASAYREKMRSKKKKRVVKLTPNSSFPTPVEKPKASLNKVEPSKNDTAAQQAQVTTTNVAQSVEKQAVNSAPAKAKKAKQAEVTKPALSQEKPVSSTRDTIAQVATKTPKTSVEKFLEKSSANAKKVLAGKSAELNDKSAVKAGSQPTVNLPVHVVQKGDSLYSISAKYNIHMKALLKWNKIRKSKLIKIGDVIYLADPKKAQVR